MNSLRSTERNIFRLAYQELSRPLQRPKPPVKVICDRPVQKKKRVLIPPLRPYGSKFHVLGNTIRLLPNLNETRSFSTSICRQDVSILNPNKPDPSKEMTVEPIAPLTMPRFTKNKSDPVPSVTKILQATMPAASRFVLERWKESMIKKLGAAGFQKYQADTFHRGSALHSLLAHYLMGRGVPDSDFSELSEEVVNNLWKSINKVVREKINNVRLVEHIVTHPKLNYRGIVDCVAYYEDELVVIDFKTAEKYKKDVTSLYDNPLQVTAYCGALNSDMSIPQKVLDRNICSGLIIIAYTDGSEASVHHFGRDEIMNNYWTQWTDRLDQFSRLQEVNKEKKSSK